MCYYLPTISLQHYYSYRPFYSSVDTSCTISSCWLAWLLCRLFISSTTHTIKSMRMLRYLSPIYHSYSYFIIDFHTSCHNHPAHVGVSFTVNSTHYGQLLSFQPLLCHLENVEYQSTLSPAWHSNQHTLTFHFCHPGYFAFANRLILKATSTFADCPVLRANSTFVDCPFLRAISAAPNRTSQLVFPTDMQAVRVIHHLCTWFMRLHSLNAHLSSVISVAFSPANLSSHSSFCYPCLYHPDLQSIQPDFTLVVISCQFNIVKQQHTLSLVRHSQYYFSHFALMRCFIRHFLILILI